MDEETLTKTEFVNAFEIVIKVIQNLKKANEEEFNSINRVMNGFANKLKNDTSTDLTDMRKSVMEYYSKEMSKVMEKHSREMSDMDKKIGEMKEGKDTDEEMMMETMHEKIVPEITEKVKVIVEKDLPQLGEAVRDSLELLKGDERLDKSAIKGLEEALKKLEKSISTQSIGGGIVGRDIVQDYDLSSQLDGATKTFNIPTVWNIISVSLTSYPYGALRKNVDFTYTPTSITFTDTIDAPTQLASGQSCILTIITG